jgi:hypothetical protein
MKVVAKQAANLDALDRAAIIMQTYEVLSHDCGSLQRALFDRISRYITACLSNAASEVHKRFTGHVAFIYSKQAWDLWTTSNMTVHNIPISFETRTMVDSP